MSFIHSISLKKVDYHFNNLEKVAAWALCPENEKLMEDMIQRLHSFADDLLSKDSIVFYASALLSEYASLHFHNPSPLQPTKNEKSNKESKEKCRNTCPMEPLYSYVQRTRAFEVVH
jgi:hypothetical protein